jgi:hypothetical protein
VTSDVGVIESVCVESFLSPDPDTDEAVAVDVLVGSLGGAGRRSVVDDDRWLNIRRTFTNGRAPIGTAPGLVKVACNSDMTASTAMGT